MRGGGRLKAGGVVVRAKVKADVTLSVRGSPDVFLER
jgi:hypothetical protein